MSARVTIRATAALLLWAATAWAVATAPSSAPYGILLALGGTYALARWPAREDRLFGPMLARSVLLLAVALGLGFPALIGLVVSTFLLIRQLGDVGSNLLWPALLLGCGISLLLVVLARRWPERWSDGVFLLALSLSAFIAKLTVVHLIGAEPISDFGAMWRLAGSVAESGLDLRSELSRPADWLHFERILPYLLPVRLAFGPGRWSYVVPNLLATLACSWMVYHLSRRWFGRQAGRISFTVSLLAAETTLAAGIPTHDIPGTLYALAGLLVFVHADRRACEGRLRSAIALAVVLGMLLTVLDLQRTSRIFLFASFSAVLVARLLALRTAEEARRRVRRALGGAAVILALALAVSAAADGLLRLSSLASPREAEEMIRSRGIAGHSDSWRLGALAEATDAYYRRYGDLSVDDWTWLSRHKLVSDLYHNPLERLSSYVRRSVQLFSLGSQISFYLTDAEPTTSRAAWLRQVSYLIHGFSRAFTAAFLAAMLGGIVAVWRMPRVSLHAFLPALYPALMALSLLVLFQPQPRYLFPLWYLGSIYVGVFLGRRGPPQGSNDSTASITSDCSESAIEV